MFKNIGDAFRTCDHPRLRLTVRSASGASELCVRGLIGEGDKIVGFGSGCGSTRFWNTRTLNPI